MRLLSVEMDVFDGKGLQKDKERGMAFEAP
jgi:hypothetical protein